MNDQHSPKGGPRTESGKEASSRNAIKHGCCSTGTLLVGTETIEQFEALEAAWFQAYSRRNDLETHLLNQVIQADWFLQRANRALAKIETQLYNFDLDPMQWNDREHHALQRFTRYQTTRRNEFNKAKKALDDHRKIQAAETRSEEKHVIYKEKNKPKLGFLEEIQAARDQAIKLGILKPTDGSVDGKDILQRTR